MASAKATADFAKAKEKRQKKIAIGGFVLLLALLAFQVPRTLKMLEGAPTATSATTTPATTAPASTTPGPTSLEPPTLGGSGNTAGEGGTANAAAASAASDSSRFASFERFDAKDPFVQQIDESAASGSGSPTPAASASGSRATRPTQPSAKRAGAVPSALPKKGSTETTRVSTPAAPPPTSAEITVNGVKQTVSAQTDFPADNPVFRLVSLTAKTAKVGVAGGSFSSGDQTITLRVGKPVTLVNTADGARYTLLLGALH